MAVERKNQSGSIVDTENADMIGWFRRSNECNYHKAGMIGDECTFRYLLIEIRW
jgi:hypothetical protein